MIPRRRGAALVALLLTACSSQAVSEYERAVAPPATPPAAPLPATTTMTTTTSVAPTTVPPTTTTVTATTTAPTTTTAATTTIAIATTTSAPVIALEVAQAPAAPPQPQAVVLPQPLPPPDANVVEEGYALGSIEIPRIGLNKSFYEGITVPTLNRGPGHWPGTALPGQLGNVVVGGHRVSKSRPFRHLERLLPGDEVIFTTAAGRFVYRVLRTEVVTPDQMWIINQTEAYTATLFACHPAGSTTHRIVVFLELSV